MEEKSVNIIGENIVTGGSDILDFDNMHIMMLLGKYEKIVCDLFLVFNNYKNEGIIKLSEYNNITDDLEQVIEKIKIISNSILIEIDEKNNIIDLLQEINDKLSAIMKHNGAPTIQDILYITFGSSKLDEIKQEFGGYYEDILNKYIHPINYKLIPWSTIEENK